MNMRCCVDCRELQQQVDSMDEALRMALIKIEKLEMRNWFDAEVQARRPDAEIVVFGSMERTTRRAATVEFKPPEAG